MDGQLPAFFKTLPRQSYGVEPVPADIAPKYTAGRYSGAPIESNRAGMYWVNTVALNTRTLYTLEALTLHEAVPGHHLQTALQQELQNVPDFRRHDYVNAFGEGWGLYSERLGLEAGFYKDPYSNFGRLTYEMWRACRLVVDTGMHAKGWTRDQALEYMSANTALSIHEVTTETDRYIGWPGQALAYKMGELKIRELTEARRGRAGAAFRHPPLPRRRAPERLGASLGARCADRRLHREGQGRGGHGSLTAYARPAYSSELRSTKWLI